MEQPNEIEGVLDCYWSTGSEGYDWILTDKRFVTPHLLQNGDRLTIFDKQDPQKIVWDGVVQLRPHIVPNATTIIGQ